MRYVAVLVVAAACALTGCTGNTALAPDPTSARPTASATPAEPSPTPTSTAVEPTTAPLPEADAITFTYQCWHLNPDGIAIRVEREMLSWDETWAYEPQTTSCRAIQHGTTYTTLQHEAVALAGDVLPEGIDQVHELYSQCAIRANGYLGLSTLAPNQAQDVRGFLHLCPDRPGAEYLRAMLGD